MDIINSFIEYLALERNFSENTIASYRRDILSLLDFFNSDIVNLKSDDIIKYLRKQNNLSSRSKAHRISTFTTFYNYCINKGLIKQNPIRTIPRPKVEKRLPTFLTIEEVNKLLDVTIRNGFDARNKAVLELLYSSGLRISELINMQLSNLDLSDCIVRVMGKGSKERIVPLGDYAIASLKDYIDNYRAKFDKKKSLYVFINHRGDMISRQFIFKVIKLECIKKGIKKNVSPHTLRHTFATHLLKNGADLRIIQELLGHENITTTQIYTHLTNEQLRNDYNTYFPRN